jgi:hypothetical protein
VLIPTPDQYFYSLSMISNEGNTYKKGSSAI